MFRERKNTAAQSRLRMCRIRLMHGPATVYVQRLPGHAVAQLRGEEQAHARHVERRDATLKTLAGDELARLFVVDEVGFRLGMDRAWGYAIHVDIVRPHFAGQRARQSDHASL